MMVGAATATTGAGKLNVHGNDGPYKTCVGRDSDLTVGPDDTGAKQGMRQP
jgi:hypothetical protein